MTEKEKQRDRPMYRLGLLLQKKQQSIYEHTNSYISQYTERELSNNFEFRINKKMSKAKLLDKLIENRRTASQSV